MKIIMSFDPDIPIANILDIRKSQDIDFTCELIPSPWLHCRYNGFVMRGKKTKYYRNVSFTSVLRASLLLSAVIRKFNGYGYGSYSFGGSLYKIFIPKKERNAKT